MKRTAPQQTRDKLGRRLCRVPSCLKIVPRGRISYCSPECKTAFEIAYFPSQARRHVFMRDKGVCAMCGWDTEKTYRVLLKAGRFARSDIAYELGFGPRWYSGGARWQADHIHEVCRGGWGLGLENFRTLCIPCHRAETRRLRRELAAERRAAKGVA